MKTNTYAVSLGSVYNTFLSMMDGKYIRDACTPWGFYGVSEPVDKNDTETLKNIHFKRTATLMNILSSFSWTVVLVACFRILFVLFEHARRGDAYPIAHTYSALFRSAVEMTYLLTACLQTAKLTVDLFLFLMRSLSSLSFNLSENSCALFRFRSSDARSFRLSSTDATTVGSNLTS